MNELDNENRILELFRAVPTNKVCILFDDDESKGIYESIVLNKENWIDNSAKDSPPPDFLNQTESIMMEMMRVNDTNSEANRKETELQKELADSGIMDLFPNAKVATCIPNVHNQSYDNYLTSFAKAVEKHGAKISNYRNNYPDITKVVFFICDESEAYYECRKRTDTGFLGRLHTWFGDKKFMDILKMTKVDVVIWYTPYKVLERDGIDFPEVVVINPKLIDDNKLEVFNNDYMVDATQVKRVT